MDCYLVLDVDTGGGVAEKVYGLCLGFVFEKALYVPYTRFVGSFYEDGLPDISALDVVGVRVRLGVNEIHSGLADEVNIERYGRGHRVRVTSRGYTLLLAQNEPYPRINTNVTLKTLCHYFLRVACYSSCVYPWFLDDISLCKVRQTDEPTSTVPIPAQITWQPSADCCTIWVFQKISLELLVL